MPTPITIIGRVGTAELRFTPAGKAVLNVSVAVKREKYNRDTKQFEEVGTDWHRAALWDRKAEAAAEVVDKGALVVVVGELESRDFDDREGQKRTVWEIRAQEIGLIPMASRGQRPAQPAAAKADDPWAATSQSGSSFADEPPF